MERKKNDFASLLEESFQKRKSIEEGLLFQAKITSIRTDYVFIETLTEKIKGIIPIEEFTESNTIPKNGELLSVHYLSENHGDHYFTTMLTGENLNFSNLKLAYKNEIPVLGQVSSEITGGYEVKLGELVGFCPFSQIDIEVKGKSPSGKKLKFAVMEIQDGKNSKIVLSQKKITDKEKNLKIESLKNELKVGSFVTGRIKSIHKFGLIVDIGGVDALIPISESSYKKNPDLEKEFSVGQTLRAKILNIDWKEKKFSLSVKDFIDDPWAKSFPFKEGDLLEGVVETIKPFGMFVKLNENFSGLVPNKETGLPIRTPVSTHYKSGDKIEVYILEVNPEKKQIALSISKAKEFREKLEYEGYMKQDTDSSVSSFGILLKNSLNSKK
ncbi:MAG: S1 RNA-binding domain-containing protein [Leptospiraceae bacterium]|nr:S1 RNA-binding domain-containing protein [Leptospiraceae bacterium]NUM41842.1 S1 RNA-binding domain-containing protein [Leptospiraceae bacterium]